MSLKSLFFSSIIFLFVTFYQYFYYSTAWTYQCLFSFILYFPRFWISDLDVEKAKMILLRAGGEFCNLAKVELDLIADQRLKLGNHGSVIWKRLQPQVREMCDVCSTSLFNAHFTCTECGIIVCIDCHQVREVFTVGFLIVLIGI